MKIAIDLTSFGKQFRGGKEQVVINLLSGMPFVSTKTTFLLFCYDEYEKKAENLLPNAKKIVFNRWKRFHFLQDILIRTFRFKRNLGDSDLLFFPMYYTGFRKFRIPSVVLPHDIQFRSRPGHFTLKTRIKDGIMYFADFYLRDHIIAISRFDKREMKKYYPWFAGKVKYIPNPIRTCISEIPRDKKHYLVVNIGFSHKNAATVIKAYSTVYKYYDIPLVLVGSLYEKIEIRELIESLGMEDRITVTGHMDDEKLFALYRSAYAYITASEYEGFGMPSVEAMMNGVPVISSDQEALVEVTFAKAMYYSPADDNEALADCMKKLIENYPDDNYLDEMKTLAHSSYGYEVVSKKYLNFFEKITCRVIYCDPMSYSNLELYDKNMMEHMEDCEIIYAANKKLSADFHERTERLYGYSDYKSTFIKGLNYILSQIRLFFLARKVKADVIHLQWSRMPSFDNMIIGLMKRILRMKFIYTSHDTFTHNMENTRKKQFVKLMESADEILVHTKLAQNALTTAGFVNTSVINHGLLDLSSIYPAEDIGFQKNDRIVFSLLGYMEEYKGTDLLLDAWLSSQKLLCDPDIHLVVIGVNRLGYTPFIPAGSNITFRNEKISDGEFTAWMEASDVVVMPYRRISQSGLMMSAMAMGKNIVVNDVGELSEPVQRYDIGWINREITPEGLGRRLLEIVMEIKDKGLKEYNVKKRNMMEEDYSWKVSARTTRKLYMKGSR